jgi:hypothetical protein
MPQIDIDFEVFKALTVRRSTEDESYNDVIRAMLKLPFQPHTAKSATRGGRPWVVSNTSFPVGSEFMTEYKGKTYCGTIVDGKLRLEDGHSFTTPSAAAIHVTGGNANGWRFWKCKLPGETQYVLIERLRGKAH